MTDHPPRDHSIDAPPRTLRADLHCHSRASSKPVVRALGAIDMPECYSPPEKVYDQARARGMDLVTITDHDSIAGALELVERGFPNVIIGEEVTVYFPEDRCKLHVLVWNLTPALHDELHTLHLRNDVYAFAEWLEDRRLPHALAHPLYVQNGRLTEQHIDRCALLFKGWEVLNGAHSGTHQRAIEHYLAALTPRRVQDLSQHLALDPLWSRIWQKGITAGSDDHALLNVGRTWTSLTLDATEPTPTPEQFLRRVMAGHATVGGDAGHASLLAHQLATVTANYYARKVAPKKSATHRYIASKLLRFAGVDLKEPSMPALLLSEARRRFRLGRAKKRTLPAVHALRDSLAPVLARYPDLRERLDPSSWNDGSAIAQHERMADFVGELVSAVNAFMASGAASALRDKDTARILDHLISYALVNLAQLPYFFSLSHQNKERPMIDRIEHHAARPGLGGGPLERPLRVLWYTDTLGDVNGVSRFIRNMADQALIQNCDVTIVTSTGFAVPDQPNIINFKPDFATKMPKYEQLEIVLPPLMRMLRHADQHRPDLIHVSTPGPVGLVGLRAARNLRVPLIGTYHTDFPAYVDHLFNDHACTRMCESAMKWFYGRCRLVLSRSPEFIEPIRRLGIPDDRIATLRSGIDLNDFGERFRDESIWTNLSSEKSSTRKPLLSASSSEGADGRRLAHHSIKCLYVGRVSVEKNLPLLARAWSGVHAAAQRQSINADLIVVGDGPYLKEMKALLAGKRAHFLGFRHGRELATIYASSDLFVFPSVTDTLGQSVMEAQASGLPAVVSNQGGPKTIAAHDHTGLVVETQRDHDWATALLSLIANSDQRARFSAAAVEGMKHRDIGASFRHFRELCERERAAHLADQGITPKTEQLDRAFASV